MNVLYDKLLSFGKLAALPATGANADFPDDLNLGKAAGSTDSYPGKAFTNADRLTVDVCCDTPAGGTSITVVIKGSADGAAFATEVGKNTFTLDDLKAGPCKTAISPNKFQYLRVNVAAAGTFTGKGAEAFLNTYAGK